MAKCPSASMQSKLRLHDSFLGSNRGFRALMREVVAAQLVLIVPRVFDAIIKHGAGSAPEACIPKHLTWRSGWESCLQNFAF